MDHVKRSVTRPAVESRLPTLACVSRESGTPRAAVVVDVLGTLVNQAGGLAASVVRATGLGDEEADHVVATWLRDVEEQERAVIDGRRPFAPSHALDQEAVDRIVRAGALPPAARKLLDGASERIQPWSDSADGIEALAQDRPVLGLSNASRRTLAGLSARSGFRWHHVLSAEDAGTYKPEPALYALAVDSVPRESGIPFMVAAHAWDLRAAAAAGMRTAYVPRPGGDPPRDTDAFDIVAESLRDLRGRLMEFEAAA